MKCMLSQYYQPWNYHMKISTRSCSKPSSNLCRSLKPALARELWRAGVQSDLFFTMKTTHIHPYHKRSIGKTTKLRETKWHQHGCSIQVVQWSFWKISAQTNCSKSKSPEPTTAQRPTFHEGRVNGQQGWPGWLAEADDLYCHTKHKICQILRYWYEICQILQVPTKHSITWIDIT